MTKQCHACAGEIPENAKICRHCTSSQSKSIYRMGVLVNPGTLIISLLSLIVSLIALYFSRVTEPPSPELVVQVDRFNENGFDFFVANVGDLPTSIRDIDLKVSLQHGDGEHAVRAGFATSPTQILKGESKLFRMHYSDFVPRHTRWTTSENAPEPFSLNFLYAASSLGSNLHCEVEVYFTSRRYFPSNIDGAEGSVNGACSDAIKWFAEKIGPLRVDKISE